MPWLEPHDPLLVTAQEQVRMAALAYEEQPNQAHQALAALYSRIVVLPLRMGFVVGNGHEVVVAFVGARDGIDWAFNMCCHQEPGYGGRVHTGFAKLLESLWKSVEHGVRLARDARQELRLTGHSRGGG